MPINAQRIQAVFLAASEIERPSERAKFLDGACDGNADLRSRVEALLRAHNESDSLLDQTALAPHDHAPTIAHESGAAADDEVPLGFLALATRPDSLGRIGHYEVLQVLGQGGFGIVFRAFDDVLHRVVAVKVLSPQMAATSPARKRFLREARSSAQVRHENVVQVYEVGEQPLPYIAMEFIPGETLQQRLDRTGPIDVVEVVRIGRQIAEGLAAAHATDLIHRDIKPGNILLEGGQLRVKITDFGLARAADDASMSQSGIIAGTPMFMAPEQARGETLDQRADLFGLGSVLYVMAAGRPPFRANGTLAVLKRVAEDTPRPIREIIPETPQWLCDIIVHLQAKNPADRFQSAREVADLLADCEAQLKANSRLKDFSRIPRSKQPAVGRSGRRKWGASAVAVLLPVLALAVTEISGVSNLFRGQQVTNQSIKLLSNPQAQVPAGWHGWPADAPKPAIAPFVAAQAKRYEEEWAAYLKVPVEYTNSIGMKLRLIPPGEFTMGSTPAEIEAALTEVPPDDKHWQECIKSAGPQHKVILTQPIYLGVNEVTQAEYEKVMGQNPSHFAATGAGKEVVAGMETANHPVEMVSWNNAAEFCAKLSQHEKLKPYYFRAVETITPLDGTGYRLPSEAEWEFACRAGTATKYWIGDKDEDLVRAGWIGGNSGVRTHAAGELKANPFGLSDIHGNVWEWVEDGWDATNYGQFQVKPAISPNSSFFAGSQRVGRGGDWHDAAFLCRSSGRYAYDPTYRVNRVGFRVSLTIDVVKAAKQPTPPKLAVGPYTDADAKQIAASPAVEQIEQVRKELVRRNPGFDGKVDLKIEDGVVAELWINTDKVTDISPIRVFNALRVLNLSGTHTDWRGNSQLSDLTPLKGMPFDRLTYLDLAYTKVTDAGLELFKDCAELSHLNLDDTKVSDAGMESFKNCKALTFLFIGDTQVGDSGLAHFQNCTGLTSMNLANTKVSDAGMKHLRNCKNLEWINLSETKIGDAGIGQLKDCKSLGHINMAGTLVGDAGLASLKDCKKLWLISLDRTQVSEAGLAYLKNCMGLFTCSLVSTKVTDLSMLKELPLRTLFCDFNAHRDAKILRSIKTLEQINGKPVAEFWKDVDAR